VSRFRAMAYLGYRAIVAHPLKRLFRQRGTGEARFRAAYEAEGLAPTAEADRELGLAAQACIACGLCETGCELAAAVPSVRALGLHAVFRLYSRNPAELPLAAGALEACAGCAGGCDALCPTGVPIERIVKGLRERVGRGKGTEEGEGSGRAAGGAVDAA
jgi:heterodisulfide reductase subunit C